jgi:hypothetical protein
VPRVRPTEAAETVAVAQITGLVGRGSAGSPAPLVVRDAGHDPLTPALGLAETGATPADVDAAAYSRHPSAPTGKEPPAA